MQTPCGHYRPAIEQQPQMIAMPIQQHPQQQMMAMQQPMMAPQGQQPQGQPMVMVPQQPLVQAPVQGFNTLHQRLERSAKRQVGELTHTKAKRGINNSMMDFLAKDLSIV